MTNKHYAYFPGCTLSTTATDYASSSLAVATALGIDLAELPDWNCCGATFPLNTENVMDMLGPARTLIAAEGQGADVATLCAVCFNVLKRSDHFLRTHAAETERLNLFIEEGNYTGAVQVRHLLGILRDDLGWEAVRERVTAPLEGMRIAPYYGCLLLRPHAEMVFDDPEAPAILHDLIAALGGEPVSFPNQAECCGSYLLVSQPKATERLSHNVVESARSRGAEKIITACPLCQYNLTHAQAHLPEPQRLPVVYFSQVMAEALGVGTLAR